MKTIRSSMRTCISSILIYSILLTGFATPIFAQQQRRPIVISFGQPNIWSLEQAHYLLARMHHQNLDLQTAPLGLLDSNAANASRIDILKTLLQAGVSFDQAVGLNNELLRRDKVFNSDRRRQLLNSRSTLQSESTQLARDLASLKTAKARAGTEAERTEIQNSIDAKTEQKAAVDNELTQTNDELKGLSSATGEFQSATVPEFSNSTISGDLDSLIDKVEFINPSIAATLRLDNHIQLQYEIISKQLTLLRDEVGPGERLVFLELPQSINATQDRAEDKMAQTWWRIAGYTIIDRDMVFRLELSRLLAEIAEINTALDASSTLRSRNEVNKRYLQRTVDEVCNEKARLEAEIIKLQDELNAIENSQKKLEAAVSAATKVRDTAQAELDEAIKSGNHRRILQARQMLEDRERLLQTEKGYLTAFIQSRDSRCPEIIEKINTARAIIETQENTIKEKRLAIREIDEQIIKLDKDHARLVKSYTSLSTKYERLKIERVRQDIRAKRDRVERLLQGGAARTEDIVQQVINLLPGQAGIQKAEYKPRFKIENATSQTSKRPRCPQLTSDEAGPSQAPPNETARDLAAKNNCDPRTFINLEESTSADVDDDRGQPRSEVRNRVIRTVDIIPRQNAINVQDTKQRVSRTGIFAALSFLFGFAGKFTYERQREHAEQFLNQELFTSGFGKGEKDFGWSFYPFAGTKQLASGVRTTFAVAIIPENAETLVLKARGCYFPRKNNQPLNYNMTGRNDWIDNNNADEAKCTPDEQVFVLPVPGGSGDGADYYVTDIRYSPFQQPGNRMVVSIRGQNLPTQIGILVNGVPLREAVGLGQLNVEAILGEEKTRDNCVAQTCGRFERIDANQIVLSFETPADFEGIPRIAIIGPGREVELNKLLLTVNGDEDTQLDNADAMFGDQPDPNLRRIGDFKVAPTGAGNSTMTGVLTGARFKSDDSIFVNGSPATKTSSCRKDLCIITFSPQQTDYVTVTISPVGPDEKSVSKTFLNPSNLTIISASVVNYEPEEGPRPGVLTVKLDGSGFKEDLLVTIPKSEGGDPDRPRKVVTSAGQMFLKIIRPEAVVHINVTDTANNRVVSAVVIRPEPPKPEKK